MMEQMKDLVTDGWIDKWMDWWMDIEQVDGYTDEQTWWMDGQTDW